MKICFGSAWSKDFRVYLYRKEETRLILVCVSQGPGGHVSREEYLLGRKIDKALEQLERAEAAEEAQEEDQPPPQQNKSSYTIEHG